MEEGGFTVIQTGDASMQSKKAKASDGMETTMLGITQDEAQRIYKESLQRGKSIVGLEADDEAYLKA